MTATGSVGTVTNWPTDWTNYDEDNTLFHNNVTSWFSQTITSSSSSTFVGTPSPLVVDELGDLEDLYSFTQPLIDNVGGPLFEAIASRATRGRGYAPHVVYQYGITAGGLRAIIPPTAPTLNCWQKSHSRTPLFGGTTHDATTRPRSNQNASPNPACPVT